MGSSLGGKVWFLMWRHQDQQQNKTLMKLHQEPNHFIIFFAQLLPVNIPSHPWASVTVTHLEMRLRMWSIWDNLSLLQNQSQRGSSANWPRKRVSQSNLAGCWPSGQGTMNAVTVCLKPSYHPRSHLVPELDLRLLPLPAAWTPAAQWVNGTASLAWTED